MAGGNDEVSNNTKPAKGSGEKKKRKRPSKKVPTTVMQASSSGFMNLVQKLTGSAEELQQANNNKSPSPHSSPSSAPYSTTSVDVDVHTSSSPGYYTSPYSSAPGPIQDQYHHQQYHHDSPSYGYNNTGGYATGGGGYVDHTTSSTRSYDDGGDNRSYSFNDHSPSASSRGLDVSPFTWRDGPNYHNSTSDYNW